LSISAGRIQTEASIASASWFIAMMVAIAVLIVFFIVVCYIKRSRGEKYNGQGLVYCAALL